MEQRFSPDNSDEARAKRKAIHSWGGALITELPPRSYDHALAYVAPAVMAEVVDLGANVVELHPDGDVAA